MEKTFYRKYRPIQLSDMVGQERVVRAIIKQAEQDQFSHAYLFSGHLGSGKTSLARILSTLLTCQSKKQPNIVCGRCRSCQSIHEGQCPDVIEIDAASNRGIDNARRIKEDAYVAPQELNRKIYVLDECHKLTSDAWNALLKIIEEPPPFIHFVFCTTEHRKVPPTILSRCRRYLMTKIPATGIANRLTQISKKEGFVIEEGAALELAKMASGSLRDALVLLEDISVVTNGNVTSQSIREHLGTPDRQVVYEILLMIGDKNVAGVLDRVDDLLIAGADVAAVASELSEAFRNAMLLESCGDNSRLVELTTEEKEILKNFVNKVSRAGLIGIARSFGKIDREIELNINARWILEAALINCITNVGIEAGKSKTL